MQTESGNCQKCGNTFSCKTSSEGNDGQSITSKEKIATQFLRQNVLTSTSLENESQGSFQVGLNMHTELTSKYNAEVKNALKKCILHTKPDISFADIAGNNYAKEIINMTFILPMLCPYVFE